MARGKRTGGKIRIGELVDKVMRELNDFGGYVSTTAIRVTIKRASWEAVRELRSTSPRRTGRYASSWTNDPMGRPKADKYIEIVYSEAPYYRLTHLLEKGHRIHNGNGETKAHPHIAPVEEALGDKIEKILREEVSKY